MQMWSPEQFLGWLNSGRAALELPPLAEIPRSRHTNDRCFCARAWETDGVAVYGMGVEAIPVEKREEFVQMTGSIIEGRIISFPDGAAQWVGGLSSMVLHIDNPLIQFGMPYLRDGGDYDQPLPPLVLAEEAMA